MKRVRKTYYIRGLLEYKMYIPREFKGEKGRRRKENDFLLVEFTEGQYTGYGVSPARFTTDDPLIQACIEFTPEYRSGRIYSQILEAS